jgi:hypothetical protein
MDAELNLTASAPLDTKSITPDAAHAIPVSISETNPSAGAAHEPLPRRTLPDELLVAVANAPSTPPSATAKVTASVASSGETYTTAPTAVALTPATASTAEARAVAQALLLVMQAKLTVAVNVVVAVGVAGVLTTSVTVSFPPTSSV